MNSPTNKPVTVMIGDDHSIVIDGIELSLTSSGFNVIAKAKTVDEVLEEYEKHLPDVLVLDIKFDGKVTGLDAAKLILSKHPNAKIVFLSQHDQEGLIRETYKIGGHAFLTKHCDAHELAAAVTKASNGELYFMQEIASKFANVLLRGESAAESTPIESLDDREKEIFKYMGQGLTYDEIAHKMDLSKKTIANTAQSIKETLHVDRQADVTLLAVRLGLIDP